MATSATPSRSRARQGRRRAATHRGSPHARSAKSTSNSARNGRHAPTHRRSASNPAASALRRFARLLRLVKAAAPQFTDEQRSLLKRAMKHAHAALD